MYDKFDNTYQVSIGALVQIPELENETQGARDRPL